jgi:predicted nuclease of restriction endonuclease-like (RecB) superfamily
MNDLTTFSEYKNWLAELKQRLLTVQVKAAVAVNGELLRFYWQLGADIVSKQADSSWGSGLISRLSRDLMAEFPDMKGFSSSNLKYMRRWYLFYSKQSAIGQQSVDQLEQDVKEPILQQLFHIPWGHNIAIIVKCRSVAEALFYIQNIKKHGWSRAVLTHQIESGLWQREGKSISNFSQTLPAPQSDLAHQTLKDPYVFDFLSLRKDYNERDLELGLIKHITSFLLELGAGFAYIGRQVEVEVGERSFLLDLLFYHTGLHCYVVVELKTGQFEPEHAGKLNFYIRAVDEQLRKPGDQPTIGILLCKSKDKLVAEYALSDIHKPIGVSEYQLTQSLPEDLQSSLPTVEEIEAELAGELDND